MAATVLAVLLSGAGCGLDKADETALAGPSETGVSVQLTALPDTLNADGVSVSVVQMVLRDDAGLPVSGRAILFCTTSSINPETCEPAGIGVLVPGSTSTYVGPIQSGLVMATDRDGVANVVWVAGTERGTVTISVRPYGIDAARGFLRTVKIFQQ